MILYNRLMHKIMQQVTSTFSSDKNEQKACNKQNILTYWCMPSGGSSPQNLGKHGSMARSSGVQGQSPWSGDQRAKPPEAEALGFWTFDESPRSVQFSKIWKRKKIEYLCSLQKIMGDHETGRGAEAKLWGCASRPRPKIATVHATKRIQ